MLILLEGPEQHDHNVGIDGGHEISFKQAPFMASIRIFDFLHWCGGSIIHERFILTSAQCAEVNSNFLVFVGTDKLSGEEKGYNVEKIIIHELYSSETGDYNVAILKLQRPLTFGPTVSKVSLKGNGNLVKVKVGTMLNVTGWNIELDSERKTYSTIQQTTVPVASNKECPEQHDHNVGIDGGHEISIEQAPFMASIRIVDFLHWCGGSIIHERFILTSAQCVKMNLNFLVFVGTDMLGGEEKGYNVEKIIIHELYSNETGDYDVAILKLQGPLTFGPTVSKVLLKENGNLVKVKVGTMLNVTGVGLDSEYLPSTIQQTTVPVAPNIECERSIKDLKLTNRMMCTNTNGKGPCWDDAGGPLTWNNIQIGIITRETGCARYPSVYTRVKSVLRWIKKTISNEK
ncbi:hypothetical protein PYW07_008393 [Mythimna separata]|uniref:trypsin n=1 Tax=Mythimna separata TaxID=271217 RepID=A0AAD8DN42_MYTSE|nr:hypothetical protein PYW07_008393 [Mythimna separata]